MLRAAQLAQTLLTTLSLILLVLRLPAVQADDRRNGTDLAADGPSSASQCEARTINYITHTLPQYCLTSTWTSPTATTTAPANISSTVGPSGSDGQTTTWRGTDQQGTGAPPTTTTTNLEADGPVEEATVSEPVATSFMSFEDWKEMMLRRTGQDPQDLRLRKLKEHSADDRTPPDLVHSGLGEEDEISLNFDEAYMDSEPKGATSEAPGNAGGDSDLDNALAYKDGQLVVHGNKDAGKTCKERFSYSSFDAGATVLKSSPGAKNARAILVENKDSYMLLECGTQNKFIIVELSDDITVDTIVIANFEFFSSMIRHFRLSVSDRYPVKIDKWMELGTFEARNSRDIQAFLVENPQIFAKYVRIEFLTHYGKEYYCPVSLIRVHGTRLLDSWKDNLEPDEAEEKADMEMDAEEEEKLEEQDKHEEGKEQEDAMKTEGTSPWPIKADGDLFTLSAATCTVPPPDAGHSILSQSDHTLADIGGEGNQDKPSRDRESRAASVPPTPTDSELTRNAAASSSSSANPGISSTSSPDHRATVSADATNSTAGTTGEPAANATNTTSKSSPAFNVTGAKNRSSSTSSAAATSPTVQQGFFNAITQRLQQVEANLTLSLKYVEDQSRHMQEALQRAEQKQSYKVASFLDDLNRTVLSELRSVRDQYDQIWQSTVIALDSQRDQSERDIVALGTRLNILADEVVFQKRMAIVQAVLLLSCLALVIFSRGVPIPYLAPLLEQSNTASYGTSSPASLDVRNLYRARPDTHRIDSETLQPRSGPQYGIALSPPENLTPVAEVDPEPDHELAPGVAEYHHLSPPSTPSIQSDTVESDSSLPCYDTDVASLHRLSSVQLNHSRKPLPALPEHPSSP